LIEASALETAVARAEVVAVDSTIATAWVAPFFARAKALDKAREKAWAKAPALEDPEPTAEPLPAHQDHTSDTRYLLQVKLVLSFYH
jgi:hypothetical protein